MAKRTGRCKELLSQDQRSLLNWAANWVGGREYYRATEETEKLEAWDVLANADKGNPDFYKSGDPNLVTEDLTSFMSGMNESLSYDVPGWDDANCTWNLAPYACLAYAIASLKPEERSKAFEGIKIAAGMGKTIEPPLEECKPASGDAAYAKPLGGITSPPSDGAKEEGTTWWPWLLGAAGLGVVGLLVFTGGKKGLAGAPARAHAANPRKRKPFAGLRTNWPPAKFNLGDEVLIDGRWPGTISFNAGYDEFLGEYRYKVLEPGGKRHHWNESSLTLVRPASDNPADGNWAE